MPLWLIKGWLAALMLGAAPAPVAAPDPSASPEASEPADAAAEPSPEATPPADEATPADLTAVSPTEDSTPPEGAASPPPPLEEAPPPKAASPVEEAPEQTEPPVEEAPPPAPGMRSRAPLPSEEEAPAAPPPTRKLKPKRPMHPRLTLAGGPIVGPHAIGNEECREQEGACETTGGFFGFGVQSELRVRVYKLLYAHARALLVGNVSPNSQVYRGLWGLGAGIGAYGRYAFVRGEYLFVDAFGDNTFAAPFANAEAGSDEWGHHAGLLSAGFRKDILQKLGIELWGGPMFGPRSRREFADLEPDRRVLITFLVGLSISYDIVQ